MILFLFIIVFIAGGYFGDRMKNEEVKILREENKVLQKEILHLKAKRKYG